MSLKQPLRYPDLVNPGEMTRRAWWLLLLSLLLPGSAQLVAGSRFLARVGLVAALVFWGGILLAALGLWLNRALLLSAMTDPTVLLVGQWLLLALAAVWVLVQLDTLRLLRFVRVRPGARPWLAAIAIVALVLPPAGLAYGAHYANVSRGVLEEVFGGTQIAEPVNGRYNILLLGGDAGEGRIGLRPDSISVVSIEAETGRASIIGVPRNLQRAVFSEGSPMLQKYPDGYNCGAECLISYLNTIGDQNPELYPDAARQKSTPGIEATRDAVEGSLGITIQYYVLVDMGGFKDLIDALGGVEIDVQKRLPKGGKMVNGALTGVKGWIEPGLQHMDGSTALWYARSRVTTDDYDRMERQRELQDAVLRQINAATVLSKFESIAQAGKRTVSTDIPAAMLSHFVELALLAKDQPMDKLELVPPQYSTARPDFAEIRRDVALLLLPRLMVDEPPGAE